MGMKAVSSESAPPACPHLPVHLWAVIARHALAAADGPVAALKAAATLLAVSHDVAAAVRDVPLHLDFQAAAEDDLVLLLPLAGTVQLHTLLLGAQHGSGESLLRSHAITARSGGSLRRLAATVACTDTVQRYPGLQELHLHAGAVEQLYPAVLHGLPSLRHLGLHGYRELQLEQLLPCVAATLQVLEVTPRPEAMNCYLDLRLPPAVRLRRLTVHGSFERIVNAEAAPHVIIDPTVIRQCMDVSIEGGLVTWRLQRSKCIADEAELGWAGMLLHPHAAWGRIELRLLCGMLGLKVPSGRSGEVGWSSLVHVKTLAEELNQLGRGQIRASLHSSACSIFNVESLVLEQLQEPP